MKRSATSRRGGLKENLKFPLPVYNYRGEMVGTLLDKEAVRKFLATDKNAVLTGSRVVQLPPSHQNIRGLKSDAAKIH